MQSSFRAWPAAARLSSGKACRSISTYYVKNNSNSNSNSNGNKLVI